MFITDKCSSCGLCVNECPMHSISIYQNKAKIVGSCISCGHCYSICPMNAVESSFTEVPSSPLSEFIYARKSIRQYKDKPIDKRIIEKIISRSSAYPSAMNQKATEVTVITNKGLLDEIKLDVMNNLKSKYKLLDYPFISLLAQFILKSNYKRAIRYKDLFDSMNIDNDLITFKAPCLVFIHGEKNKICIDEDSHYVSYNMILTGLEEGLGSCFMGFIKGFLSKKIKDKIIPSNHKIYSVFTLGYPDVEFRRYSPQELIKNKIID